MKEFYIAAVVLAFSTFQTFGATGPVPGDDPAGLFYKSGHLDETYFGIFQGVNLYAEDGPGPESPDPTHLTVQSGSVLNGSITARGYSKVTAIETQVQGTVYSRDFSLIDLVSGGYGNIYVYNDSTLKISAPSFGQIQSSSTAKLYMTAGHAAFLRAFGDSRMYIQGGGTLSYLVAAEQSRVDISGGRFAINPTNGAYVSAQQNSEISVSGGNFTLWSLGHVNRIKFFAAQDGLLKFIGENFSVNNHPVTGLLDLNELVAEGVISKTAGTTHDVYSGVLRGTLRNGNNLQNEFRIERRIDSAESANIYLFSSNCLLNEELEEQLDAANASVDSLTAERDEAQALALSLQTQLDAANTSISSLTAERDAAQALASSLQNQLDAANLQIADLNVANAQLEVDLASGQAVNAGLQIQLNQANADILDLIEKNESLLAILLDPNVIDLQGAELMLEVAQVSIMEAINGGGDASIIIAAQDALDEGIAKQSSGDYKNAIKKYAKAIDLAESSLQ